MMEFDYNPCGIAPSVVKRWPECDVDPMLRPVSISTVLKPLDEAGTMTHDVYPRGATVHWFVMGVRVFNGPREVIIEKVCMNRYPPYHDSVYRAPFDAAAFNLDGPPLPLLKDGSPYAGEPMRFVKQDLGCIIRHAPMCLVLRPWEKGAVDIRFDALLIVREELSSCYPENFGRMPPTCPPYSGGK